MGAMMSGGSLYWRKYHIDKYTCNKPTQKSVNFFQKLGVRGSALKWDHGLSLEIPPPILAKLQDGASTISAANSCPAENSYQLLPDVSMLVQRGCVSPCTKVKTCGSMVSSLVIRAK